MKALFHQTEIKMSRGPAAEASAEADQHDFWGYRA
jgi:hypothetical protein